ncbi:MAG: hypothetical protein AAFW68_11245 [Pseudomonadota bacterium]
MATAIRGSGGRYDVRPAKEEGGLYGGPLTGLFGMGKDACQGACAGFLSLMGATHLTGGQSAFGTVGSNIDFLDRIWASLSANGLAGPVELLGGVALFLAARRTVSRTIGLLAFVAFVVAYANGYSLADMISILSNLLQGAATALESIPTSETA